MARSASVHSEDDGAASAAPVDFDLPAAVDGSWLALVWPALHELRLEVDRSHMSFSVLDCTVFVTAAFGLIYTAAIGSSFAACPLWVFWAAQIALCGALVALVVGFVAPLVGSSERRHSSSEQKPMASASLCIILLSSLWPLAFVLVASNVTMWKQLPQESDAGVSAVIALALSAVIAAVVAVVIVPCFLYFAIVCHPFRPTMFCSLSSDFAVTQHCARLAVMAGAVVLSTAEDSVVSILQAVVGFCVLATSCLLAMKSLHFALLRPMANLLSLVMSCFHAAIAVWLWSGNVSISGLWIPFVAFAVMSVIGAVVFFLTSGQLVRREGSSALNRRNSARVYAAKEEANLDEERPPSPSATASSTDDQASCFALEALVSDSECTSRTFVKAVIQEAAILRGGSDVVSLECFFDILDVALQRWSDSKELRLFYGSCLVDASSDTNHRFSVRLARVVDGISFATAPLSQRFLAFCLFTLRLGMGSSSTRQLARRFRKLNTIRLQILSLQSQFWKTLLVDKDNTEYLNTLNGQINILERTAEGLWNATERLYRGNPAVLRERARYVADVHADTALSMNLLSLADTLEDKNARTASTSSKLEKPHSISETSQPASRRSAGGSSLQWKKNDLEITPTLVDCNATSMASVPRSGNRSPASAVTPNGRIRWSAVSAAQEDSSLSDGEKSMDAYNVDEQAIRGESGSEMGESDGTTGSSAQGAAMRSRQIREDFLSRPSQPVTRTWNLLYTTITVLSLVVLVLFIMAVVVIQPPLSNVDVKTSMPTSTSDAALSYGYELINRMRTPIAGTASAARTWLDDLVMDKDRVSRLAGHRLQLDQLDEYMGLLQKRTSPEKADEKTKLFSYSGTESQPYETWTQSAVEVMYGTVPSVFAASAGRMLDCVVASNYQQVGNASLSNTWTYHRVTNRSKSCTQTAMFAAYNGNDRVWAALDVLADAYKKDLDSTMAGIVGAMSSVTVLVCVVVVLIVLFGLMPSVKNVDAERDSMFGLLATLDKSVLKQQYEDAKSKVKSERHQAQGQVRSNGPLAIGSSMAGSSTTSTASRSTPFIITAVLILLYSLLFAVLLSLYIADLYAVNVYVSQFPLLESSATRSHAMVLEALAPTPSPFGTNAAVRRLISRFANEMIDSWSQIGQGKTGIAFKSPELHQAMLEPSCTLGVSGKEQSCKSLEDTVLDLHDRLSYFGTSTDANDFSVSGTAFNEYRVPLRDHLPVKLNVAYNAFVDYYNARANAYRAVAIVLMVIAVIMFPIVYYLGAHRPMKNLQRDHLLVRGLFLLVPMNVAEGHAQIWAYITGTDFDIGNNAGSAASRNDKNMDKFAESLVASAKQSFFVVHRLKGYIMFGNPAASELTGMSADALMGLHFEDLLKDASELRRLLSSSGSFTFEAVLESGQCPVEVHLTVPSSAQAHVLITMRDQTMEKKSSRLLVEEKKRGIELLHSILPPPVALKLMGDERPIAFSHDAVCTLFCDIVGFTPLTSQQSAQQTVAMLDLLFSQFDEAARKNSCTRIKSIGDCAFLCCGITVEGVPIDPGVMPNQRRNLVRDMVETAKEMISIAQRQDIQVRIGVNIGPAISGVIGRDKFAFDLWGDSVNVASRMESTSEPGRIHLSRAAYEHVYDMYKCEERSVDVKGKGTMQTYLMH